MELFRAQLPNTQPPPKRKAAQAGLDGNITGRSVKRRASKACQCCRARKVRCNVTEHGAPCTNCRLDEVECIVSESRRKKKWSKDDDHLENTTTVSAANRKLASREALDGFQTLNSASSRRSHEAEPRHEEHVPHSIYQSHGTRLNSIGAYSDIHHRLSINSQANGVPTLPFSSFGGDGTAAYFGNVAPKFSAADLPLYIKPLPSRIGPDEVSYLEKKGALTIPKLPLRNEMLRAYVEFVHPYMPLIDLHDFLMVIDRADGSLGKVSLILFQAVMFAGSAFVDMHHLCAAGYVTRKEARKDFFQKTRLLYDFDYESDRVSLVQSLLLLTYYYETPDDQKDTWHWMGVATSVAHTIGLHRNPDKTNMDTKRTKLWKRIWWSTYMRDRLIALGMRRPTRIKTEDFDVPMLTLDDFEIAPLPDSISSLPADCRVARDVDMQRQLAIMCIEKAKLCLCISHVLSKQYCVLNNNQGMMNDRTTMMLLPKKLDPETSEVKACDEELQKWVNELPEEAKYSDALSGNDCLDLHRALLHMVFFTTLSALHRPQVLPSAQGGSLAATKSSLGSEFLEVSRRNVRRAASAITSIAQRLESRDLVKYLPTTGVTVLLPAIIIHLLDIKAPDEETRRSSLRGFCQCMGVMGKLRDLYAAADYSTAFLEAAIRKAGIHIAPTQLAMGKPPPVTTVTTVEALTPPPDSGTTNMQVLEKLPGQPNVTDEEVARRLETFLASTPPESDHDHDHDHDADVTIPDHDSITISADPQPTASTLLPTDKISTLDFMRTDIGPGAHAHANMLPYHQDSDTLFSSLPMNHEFDDGDFDSLLNLDSVGETFNLYDEGALPTGLQGELGDVDWMGSLVEDVRA
ncbi:cutinase transcription factor 1 alpha [Lojkania enalia]|uniref:Cutinase transcription factor 1 alpha n=1 Tax=Lojkania enalia TaxID=147567 RepID=A0A9P4N639_9PLEO|nr:cutinase transcription factor 1 alpha [Didymosphaeria enalia]